MKYLLVLVVVLFAAAGAARAQQIVGGRALDANLRVGSGGLNSPTVHSGASGISQPNYSAAYNPQIRSSAAISQNTYYITGSASSSSRYAAPTGYKAPTGGGVTYASGGATYYDPMAKPLYTSMGASTQVQVGSYSGVNRSLSVNTAPGVAAPRYQVVR